jgi:hypothetical protein
MPEIVPPALAPIDRPDACIEACYACARTCLETAMHVCLPSGGKHADPEHLGLMFGCAQICRATAEFMTASSVLHGKVCGVCAEVSEACAHSCTEIGGMDDCVAACRHCADLCRRMALGAAAQ